MSWFIPNRANQESAARFDAVIARNLQAQHRSAEASQDVTEAATDNRCHIAAAVEAFRERTEKRRQSREQTLGRLLERDL